MSFDINADIPNQQTTTLYVGWRFEVRDHDALVKYVFNGRSHFPTINAELKCMIRE